MNDTSFLRRAAIGLGGVGGLGALALVGGLFTASPALACRAVPTDAYGGFSMDCSDTDAPRFVAIARETNGEAIGFAWNQFDRTSAENAAVESCDRQANRMGACSSVVWTNTGCAAIAFSADGTSGTGFSADAGEAVSQALGYCDRDDCKLRQVVCNN